jgi:Tol biopolymer transport system component
MKKRQIKQQDKLPLFTTNQMDANEFVFTSLVKLCRILGPRYVAHHLATKADKRHFWVYSDGSRCPFVLAVLLSLALLVLVAGCQPPQVPKYDATPSPSALRIAYLDGKNLHMMKTDGSDITLLARDLQPTECAPYYISPDGQWVAYQQADGGLLAVPTSGGAPIMLSDAIAGSVSWFPDSSGVVYTLDDDVYAQWLDTSQPPQALAVGGRRYLFPAWSPDGKYIAFLETTTDPGVYNVILIHSDGTGWRTLGATAPRSSEKALCPDIVVWSPDSTRFLVDLGEPPFAFYVTGGSPVQMGAGSSPTNHAWSPDGRSLTYQDELGQLWLAKADGSDHRLLTGFPVSEAIWSPQDSQVAFIAQRDDDVALEIIDVQSGDIHSLTSGDNFVESSPHWTPDGTYLIFARYVARDQTSSADAEGASSAGIWRVAVDSSASPQRLALTGGAIQVFAIR